MSLCRPLESSSCAVGPPGGSRTKIPLLLQLQIGEMVRLAPAVLGVVLLVGLCRSASGSSASLISRWPRSALPRGLGAPTRLLAAYPPFPCRASRRDAPRAFSPAPSPARACRLSTWLASPHGCLVRAGAGLRLRGGAPATVPAPPPPPACVRRAQTLFERAGMHLAQWGWSGVCASQSLHALLPRRRAPRLLMGRAPQVVVKTLKGEALDVEVEDGASVLDLKRKLAVLKVARDLCACMRVRACVSLWCARVSRLA